MKLRNLTVEEPALPFHEKLFALAVVGFFILLMGLNLWVSDYEPILNVSHPHQVQNLLIEVTVEGNVVYPGIYQVKKGTTVGEVLKKAVLTEESRLGRLKLDGKITRRRKIVIR